MFLRNPQDLGALIPAETLHIRKVERVEPELGLILAFLNVDMGRFITIGHEEKESIPPLAEDSRHLDMLSPPRPITRRPIPD